MSILDEDPGLFEDGAGSIGIVTATHRYPGKLLTVRCRSPRSLYYAGCIGRKYNLEYGCPTCGSSVDSIDGDGICPCGAAMWTCCNTKGKYM